MSDPKAASLTLARSIRNAAARARLQTAEGQALELIALLESCDVTPAEFVACPNCEGRGKVRNPILTAPGAKGD